MVTDALLQAARCAGRALIILEKHIVADLAAFVRFAPSQAAVQHDPRTHARSRRNIHKVPRTAKLMLAHALGVGVVFHINGHAELLRHPVHPRADLHRPEHTDGGRVIQHAARGVIRPGQRDAHADQPCRVCSGGVQQAAHQPVAHLSQKRAEILRRACFLPVEHTAGDVHQPHGEKRTFQREHRRKSARPVDGQQLRPASHAGRTLAGLHHKAPLHKVRHDLDDGGRADARFLDDLRFGSCSPFPDKIIYDMAVHALQVRSGVLRLFHSACLPSRLPCENAPPIRAGRFQTRCGMTASFLLIGPSRISRPERRRNH